MNPNEMLRIVDSLHREKNIDKELVFKAIESAMATAAKRHHAEDAVIEVLIDRETGALSATLDDQPMDPEEVGFGRIGAQSAKQVIIQKIREAERDALLEEFRELIGQMVTGVVTRVEGHTAIVQLGNVEAILPRGETIPGESHHPNERVRAIVTEAKAQGSRVKVVLSRTRKELVKRLFEQEIPEIADGVISVNAMAREPGYRSKVAVSSSDQRVDCVGACVGVRGNRIRNINDELSGERIDIVRWNDDRQVLIPNALQPAEVDQVLLCEMIGRAIVLVREDQLSLAIGRRGQNVRLASKLCGVDIEIMTADELDEQIDRAVTGFSQIEGMNEELAQALVEQGYLSYDDLSVIEPDELMEMGGLTMEQVENITNRAEKLAEEAELLAKQARERQRRADQTAKEQAAKEQAAKEQAAKEQAAGTEQPAQEEEQAAEPATAEPATAEPATAEPATAEPATAEPATAEPATAEPATAEPATAEPATAEPATAETESAGPASGAGPAAAEPDGGEPSSEERGVEGEAAPAAEATSEPVAAEQDTEEEKTS